MSLDTTKIIAGVVLACVYVAGLILLAWERIITGQECLGAAGAIALPLVGALVHNSGVQSGTRAAIATPVATVSRRHTTQEG